ncbi:PREDICTED: putative UPF0481 protein At3g02645 [Nelumbo nucifera]|nr:PREDICTED: putative UPF0481 protein At3g02645 [Nelumbo nucifera]
MIIRHMLKKEPEDDHASIFIVPKTLKSTKPDSYIPQHVTLGPYHYRRPELYEMVRYKHAAVRTTHKQLHSIGFEELVEEFKKQEPRIRSSYHKYLDFDRETLAWMMAVDASFLLEFLHINAVRKGSRNLTKVSSGMAYFIDYARTKSDYNPILRDIVMLENQIPLFLLKKILDYQCLSPEIDADDVLYSILMDLCKELSPLKMIHNFQRTRKRVSFSEHFHHLLDFLYSTIVPRLNKEQHSEIDEVVDGDEGSNNPAGDGRKEETFKNCGPVKQVLEFIWKMLSNVNKGPMHSVTKVLASKPVKVVLQLPWEILSRLPGFAILKQPAELFSQGDGDGNPEDDDSSSTNSVDRPPLIEEITIPSVTELHKCGVRFSPTNGDITTISFDVKRVTFHLPKISLDVNTEVVLRNLVAYETSAASGPLIFTRYTELMTGIIDTKEDAELLRERGIILNRLKSDEEVANLWNGMSKSVKLTKVELFDKVIEDVNKYYGSRWKVKAKKFLKAYVFGSWQLLTLLAALMLLLLMTLQAFCSVYSCPRIFNVNTTIEEE